MNGPRRIALCIALVTTGGFAAVGAPTVAGAVAGIVNADQVDGRDAVGAGASLAARAGKLVATNSDGRLPNNIIGRAPDADRLDGINSTAFARTGHKHDGRYARKSHAHTSTYQPKTSRTTIVGAVADAIQSGTALRAALAAIPSTGAEAPESGTRWVVYVGPGTFDLGSQTLSMRPNVDIVGAGRQATVISCTCSGGNALVASAVMVANGSALRSLTVQNVITGSSHATAVAVPGSVTAVLSDVLLDAQSENGNSFAILVDSPGMVTADRVDLVASTIGSGGGWGVYMSFNTTSPQIRDSTVQGTHSIWGSAKVANTMLSGDALYATCIASFDVNFSAVGANCNP